MAAPTAFIPLFVQPTEQAVSSENQIFYQSYHNLNLVTDVATTLGAEVEQTSTDVIVTAPTAAEVPEQAVANSAPSPAKKPRRRKSKTEPEKPNVEQKVFHYRLPRKIQTTLNEEQQQALIPSTPVTKDNVRKLGIEGQNTIVELVKSVNPYCVFAIRRNRIKTLNSRKHAAPFFNGVLRCSIRGCPVVAFVKIQNEARENVEIEFEGEVTHLSNEVFGLKRPPGRQQGFPRKEAKKKKLEPNLSKLEGNSSTVQEESLHGNSVTSNVQSETENDSSQLPVSQDGETVQEICLEEGTVKAEETHKEVSSERMFHCKLPEWCTVAIPEEKRNLLTPIVNPDGSRCLARDGQNLVIESVTGINPFCVFAIMRNRVKAEKSRKRNCVFFYGILRCTLPNCLVKAKVKLRDENYWFLEIQFEGQVNHTSSALFGLKSLGTRWGQKKLTFKGPKQEDNAEQTHLLNLSELDRAAFTIRKETPSASDKTLDVGDFQSATESCNPGEELLTNCAQILIQSSCDNQNSLGTQEETSEENPFLVGHFEEGMFHCKLPENCIVVIPDARKHLLTPAGGGRHLPKEGLDLIMEAVSIVNPFCLLTFALTYVKSEASSKKKSTFFRGQVRCNVPNCLVKGKIRILDEKEPNVEIWFEGEVFHYSDERLGLKTSLDSLEQFKIMTVEEVTEADETVDMQNTTEGSGDESTLNESSTSLINTEEPNAQDSKPVTQESVAQDTQSSTETAEMAVNQEAEESSSDQVALVGRFEGGMFRCQLPEKCRAYIPKERKSLLTTILSIDGKRRLTKGGQKLIIETVTKVNPYCLFSLKKHYVKALQSRKRNCAFFRGTLVCTFQDCPVKAFLVIEDEASLQQLDIVFNGELAHKSNLRFGELNKHTRLGRLR